MQPVSYSVAYTLASNDCHVPTLSSCVYEVGGDGHGTLCLSEEMQKSESVYIPAPYQIEVVEFLRRTFGIYVDVFIAEAAEQPDHVCQVTRCAGTVMVCRNGGFNSHEEALDFALLAAVSMQGIFDSEVSAG